MAAKLRQINLRQTRRGSIQDWIKAVGEKTAYIEPGSPWENGYCESFNARFRDEFLNGETFYSLREAQILIEEWNLSGVQTCLAGQRETLQHETQT